MISRRKELVSTGTLRSPEAECPTWAAGISTQTFGVTIGGPMGSGRKKLGIPVTIWKGEGELSTVSESSEMICWLACVIALSLRSNTKPRKGIARKRVSIARRVGKVRTRWPRHRRKSPSRSLHCCASWRGFTSWSTLNETSPLSALPHAAVSQWHVEKTYPALPHASTTGSIPGFVSGTSLMRMLWRSVNENDDVAPDPAKHGNADWTEEIQKRLAQTILHSTVRGGLEGCRTQCATLAHGE